MDIFPSTFLIIVYMKSYFIVSFDIFKMLITCIWQN